jgi:hypothetical protein
MDDNKTYNESTFSAVANIMLGNGGEVKGNLYDSLSSIVSDSIELKKLEMSNNMFNEKDKE